MSAAETTIDDSIDVSGLPDHAFGSRSILWWATVGIIAIEATLFVAAIAAYYYLRGNEESWPPAGVPPPGLFWPTLNTAVLFLSCIPNHFLKKAAENKNLTKIRIWIVVAVLFAVVFTVLRGYEYTGLGGSWDLNAYTSITWTLLSLHSFHIVTDLLDTLVLMVMMFTHHGEKPKRMVDVSENCFYWYFVVLAWIPIYLVVYWSPRWM
jgi:heme/copper-type cytochrome/quinol oxidase subunit 3